MRRPKELRTTYWWIIIALIFLWSLVDEQIGVPLADWGDPVTATDLLAYFVLAISILTIEVRDVGNYLAKKLDYIKKHSNGHEWQGKVPDE